MLPRRGILNTIFGSKLSQNCLKFVSNLSRGRKPPEFPFLQRLEAHVRAMRRAFHDAADSLFMVLMRGEGVWL